MSNKRRRRRTAEPMIKQPARDLVKALAGVPDDAPTIAEVTVSQLFGVSWQEEGLASVPAVASLLVESCRALGAGAAGPARAVASMAPADVAEQLAIEAASIPGELPGWAKVLDRIALLDAVSMDEPFGDQTYYMLKFGYRYGISVIGPHILWVVVNHNVAAVVQVDLYESEVMGLALANQEPEVSIDRKPDLAEAAQRILDGMGVIEDDEDGVHDLSEEARDCWFLLASRVHACLPPPAPSPRPASEQEREDLRARFMASDPAASLLASRIDDEAARPRVIEAIAQIIIDFACDDGRRPDRWSPKLVHAFFEYHALDVDWHPVAIPWVGPTLAAYLEFVVEGEGKAAIVNAVWDSADAFVEEALPDAAEALGQDLGARMREAGIDVNDLRALEDFVAEYNRSLGL